MTDGIDEVWARIDAHAGETFRHKRGAPFRYTVEGTTLATDRTTRTLHISQFRRALARMPVDGPGAFQDLQGPSYLWAILTDPRICREPSKSTGL